MKTNKSTARVRAFRARNPGYASAAVQRGERRMDIRALGLRPNLRKNKKFDAPIREKHPRLTEPVEPRLAGFAPEEIEARIKNYLAPKHKHQI